MFLLSACLFKCRSSYIQNGFLVSFNVLRYLQKITVTRILLIDRNQLIYIENRLLCKGEWDVEQLIWTCWTLTCSCQILSQMHNMPPGKQDEGSLMKLHILMKDDIFPCFLDCAVLYNMQLVKKMQFWFCIACKNRSELKCKQIYCF